jgi:hypothetical protein
MTNQYFPLCAVGRPFSQDARTWFIRTSCVVLERVHLIASGRHTEHTSVYCQGAKATAVCVRVLVPMLHVYAVRSVIVCK